MVNKIIAFITRKHTTKYYWTIRKKAASSNVFIRYLNRYKHQKLMEKFNANIPLSSKIEGMPTFPHGLNGIFISAGASIGKNCTIFHQVTIGSNTLMDSDGQGCPTIGDNVYIGCGAKIIGGVHIGNNVRIGANCVVVRDVPDNCTVVLEKPRIIQKEGVVSNEFINIYEYKKKTENT